ncbi:MAG: hypothetical protein Q9192_003712 [Flavoplaca navasiana]
MGPPKEPTTTMLKLDLLPGLYTAPLAEVSGNEITDTTAEVHPSIENTRPADNEKWSCELITWTIPPHLDPTYHQIPAHQFDSLGKHLDRCETTSTSFEPRDLAGSYRGWGFPLSQDLKSATVEPNEKTHLFFFIWANAEKERKWKDGTSTDALYVSWDENFMKLQREWEAMGMRTESLHLRLEDFEEQLMWRKVEMEKAKREGKGV